MGLPGVIVRFVHVPDNMLLAREGHGDAKGGHMGETQQDIAELAKQTPLEQLRQKIGEHVLGLTIPKSNIVRVEAIGNKEIPNINVAGLLAG